MKTNRIARSALVLTLILLLLSVSAFAALESTSTATKNGIEINVGASAYSCIGTSYAVCNSATRVSTTIRVYNTHGVQTTPAVTASGRTDALANSGDGGSDAFRATGTSNATINGTSTTGPSTSAYFD